MSYDLLTVHAKLGLRPGFYKRQFMQTSQQPSEVDDIMLSLKSRKPRLRSGVTCPKSRSRYELGRGLPEAWLVASCPAGTVTSLHTVLGTRGQTSSRLHRVGVLRH